MRIDAGCILDLRFSTEFKNDTKRAYRRSNRCSKGDSEPAKRHRNHVNAKPHDYQAYDRHEPTVYAL